MWSTGWLSLPILLILIFTHFRAFLTEEQREQFGEVVLFFKQNVDPLSKDLAFLLGDEGGLGGNENHEKRKYFRILCEDGCVPLVDAVHQTALA